MASRTPASQLVTVFGGSGFVGRHVVRALARRGYRVRAAVRRPDLAGFLQPLGIVGQVTAVQANLRFPDSVHAALRGADAAINLVGILKESGRQTFSGVQTHGARAVAEACAAHGITRFVQMSALGADPESLGGYGRSKAAGEAAVLQRVPEAVILRPSVLFGSEDQFFNRFAALARMLPVIPLAQGESRFQPAFVGDVAEVIARAVDGTVAGGRIYELGGPEVRTLREFVAYTCAVAGRERRIVELPPTVARIQARILEIADALTLGLIPDELVITRDQLAMLATDNVVSEAAQRDGRSFEGLGIRPVAVEAVVPSYLWRFRKTGQFDTARAG